MTESNLKEIADAADMIVQKYIKKHYMEMYETWARDSQNGFYEG